MERSKPARDGRTRAPAGDLMPFTAESAAEAGRKSGNVRRRRREPDARARDALKAGVIGAAEAVIAASRASEGFEDIKPELRLKAAFVVLEYVLGKPKGFEEEIAPEEIPADPFAALLATPEEEGAPI